MDAGVRVMINAPAAERFDTSKPTRLILYTLPNGNTIERSYGSDTDGWIGKEITLFVAPVQFQGKMVNGLRVRAPTKPAPGKPVKGGGGDPRPEPPFDDAIPF